MVTHGLASHADIILTCHAILPKERLLKSEWFKMYRPLLQHTLKLEKKIAQYIFQISTWKVFLLKNIFIMKSLNNFRKMVEASVDLVPLRLTLQLPEYLLQIPQVVFHAEEAAA